MHTGVANFYIGLVKKPVQFLMRKIEKKLPIFVFEFRLIEPYYLLFPISFNFIDVGAVVIVFRTLIGECVSIARFLQWWITLILWIVRFSG